MLSLIINAFELFINITNSDIIVREGSVKAEEICRVRVVIYSRDLEFDVYKASYL
jgi:hypothetical protein